MSDVEDITPAQVTEALGDFSDAFTDAVDTRIEKVTMNWLMAFGIPQTPSDTRFLIGSVYKTAICTSVVSGHLSFTETGKASDEEKAARPGAVEREPEELDGHEQLSMTGQYL